MSRKGTPLSVKDYRNILCRLHKLETPHMSENPRSNMSIAKVIEVLAEGATLEGAIEDAVKEASKTIKNIVHIYVNEIQAEVKDNKIKKYRVNAKVTFIVGKE